MATNSGVLKNSDWKIESRRTNIHKRLMKF